MEQAIDLNVHVYEEGLKLGDPMNWRQREWQKAKYVCVSISCGHHCSNRKDIFCSSPIQLRYALKSAQCEIFYCHVHRLTSWKKLGIIPDFLLPHLQLVQKLGACNKSKTRLPNGAIDFLVEIGLISIVPVQHGARTIYKVQITEAGEQHLEKNADRLDLYMSHQVRDSQIEWNWVPSNTDWPHGIVV